MKTEAYAVRQAANRGMTWVGRPHNEAEAGTLDTSRSDDPAHYFTSFEMVLNASLPAWPTRSKSITSELDGMPPA